MIFNDNYNPQNLREAIQKIDSDTIILSFLDKEYIPLFDVFYENISKFKYDNLLIVSLDEESEEHLKDNNINTVRVKYKVHNRHRLWYERFLFIEHLFTYFRKSILHTDVDCVWYKDIYSELNDIDLDFIISTAHGYPEHIEKEFGFLGCMGLFLCNYNERTIDFFKNARDAPFNKGIEYDQVLVNNYIFYSNPDIYSVESGPIQHRVITKGVKIGFLSEKLISRDYRPNLSGYHPVRNNKSVVNFAKQLREAQ